MSKQRHCDHCGYRGTPRREGVGLVWLAVFMWLIPLAFLSFGFWPFFLLPAVAVTAWAVSAYRLRCPACGELLR